MVQAKPEKKTAENVAVEYSIPLEEERKRNQSILSGLLSKDTPPEAPEEKP